MRANIVASCDRALVLPETLDATKLGSIDVRDADMLPRCLRTRDRDGIAIDDENVGRIDAADCRTREPADRKAKGADDGKTEDVQFAPFLSGFSLAVVSFFDAGFSREFIAKRPLLPAKCWRLRMRFMDGERLPNWVG